MPRHCISGVILHILPPASASWQAEVRGVVPCTLVTWHGRVAAAPAGASKAGCMAQAAGTSRIAAVRDAFTPARRGNQVTIIQHSPCDGGPCITPVNLLLQALSLSCPPCPASTGAHHTGLLQHAEAASSDRQDLTLGCGCKRPSSTQYCSAPTSTPSPCPAPCCECGCPPSAAPAPAGPSCPGRRSSELPCTRDASGFLEG